MFGHQSFSSLFSFFSFLSAAEKLHEKLHEKLFHMCDHGRIPCSTQTHTRVKIYFASA